MSWPQSPRTVVGWKRDGLQPPSRGTASPANQGSGPSRCLAHPMALRTIPRTGRVGGRGARHRCGREDSNLQGGSQGKAGKGTRWREWRLLGLRALGYPERRGSMTPLLGRMEGGLATALTAPPAPARAGRPHRPNRRRHDSERPGRPGRLRLIHQPAVVPVAQGFGETTSETAAWLSREASPAKVAKDEQHEQDDDDDPNPGHVFPFR